MHLGRGQQGQAIRERGSLRQTIRKPRSRSVSLDLKIPMRTDLLPDEDCELLDEARLEVLGGDKLRVPSLLLARNLHHEISV